MIFEIDGIIVEINEVCDKQQEIVVQGVVEICLYMVFYNLCLKVVEGDQIICG